MFIPSQSTFTEAEKITLGARLASKTALTGMIAGTLLETAAGWRPVEELMQGDEVYTFDGGLRAISRLERRFIAATETAAEGLVHIPGGILSNSEDLLVLPEQSLLIETSLRGGVGSLVKADDLVGSCGIVRTQADHGVQIIRPIFDEEEVLWANAGLLFHCAAPDGQDSYFPTATTHDLPAIRAILAGCDEAADFHYAA